MTSTVISATREEAELTALTNQVSRAQFTYVMDLARDRLLPQLGDTPEERTQRMIELFVTNEVTRANVSRWIDMLRSCERFIDVSHQDALAPVKPGVYELNGDVYVVKQNKAKTNVDAKKHVELNTARRLTDAGEVVDFDLVYSPGVVRKLREEHRMTLARAEELGIRYGKCLNCRRTLRAAKSVKQAYGPVCFKAFRED